VTTAAAVGRASSSLPASGWRVALALLWVELRLLARRPENLLVSVAVPVAVLGFLGAVPIVPGTGPQAIDRLLPGTFALAVIAAGFVNLGIATAYERSYGVLKRLGAAPISMRPVVLAKVAAVLAVVALTMTALAGVGWVLGWRPTGGWPGIFGAGALLGTAAFAGLGLGLAGLLRGEAMLAVANGLFVVFTLFGGVLVPASELPGYLGDVARALPSSALVDAFRAGLGDPSIDWLRALAVLGGWSIGAGLLAIVAFRWD
jgi:ABC-2 type transport system permease protein